MRKLVHHVLSLLLATIGCLPSTYAADNKGGSEIIGRFDRTFDSLDNLIFGNKDKQPSIYTGGAIMGIQSPDSLVISPQLDKALRENTAAKIHEGNGLTGLQLTGQTYYRIAGNGGVDEVDGETGQGFYRAKVQAEIRWYLLQSSLFGKKGRKKVAQLEERIARAGYEKEKTDINEFQVQQNIDQYYDSLLYGVLIHRVDLLTMLDDAQRYLLGNENISSDDIVRTLNDLLDAQRKLSEIEHKYPAAASLAGVRATTVRIDSAALVSHVATEQGDMKILRLRMDLLTQKDKNVKWWSRINVAPFVRYSNYFRHGLPNTYNLDAGLTFTIPLNDEAARQKRTIQSERAVLEAEEYRLSQRVADKTALVIAEVGRLDRASASELKRIRELRGYIARRTEAYRKGLGQYNRMARAKEYAMYIGCLERLIEYQYRRDCLVANLQSLLPDESILRFCHFIEIKD
ncbi:MAG: hypothetical protein K2K98_09895 [Muribaculaceae bacterium]|nr:hypothetical protein [Muribaculaceae bacterium]